MKGTEMKTFNMAVLVAGAGLALSGCGIGAALEVLDRAEEADAILTELESLGAATTGDMPTSGTGSYSGQTVINTMEDAETALVLTGNTVIEADFAGGTLSGTATDFVGTRMSEAELAEAEAAAANGDIGALTSLLNNFGSATGSLDFTSGAISGTGYTMDADGTIRFKGTDYVVAADVAGDFAAGGAGLTGESTAMTMTADGAATTDPTLLLGVTGSVTP